MWTKHIMLESSRRSADYQHAWKNRGRREPRRIDRTVDLFPTITELCGFGVPKTIHGRSFASLLQGRRYTPRESAYPEYYFCRNVFTRDNRYVGKPPILMVRTRDWKLNYLNWDRSELYNVREDPGEFNNRIDEPTNASVLRELTQIAERMYRSRRPIARK